MNQTNLGAGRNEDCLGNEGINHKIIYHCLLFIVSYQNFAISAKILIYMMCFPFIYLRARVSLCTLLNVSHK